MSWTHRREGDLHTVSLAQSPRPAPLKFPRHRLPPRRNKRLHINFLSIQSSLRDKFLHPRSAGEGKGALTRSRSPFNGPPPFAGTVKLSGAARGVPTVCSAAIQEFGPLSDDSGSELTVQLTMRSVDLRPQFQRSVVTPWTHRELRQSPRTPRTSVYE